VATTAQRVAGTRPVSVIVAEDDFSLREALAAVLGPDPSLQLLGTVGDAQAAIRLCFDARPDVALVDVRMPGGGGLRAIREIRRLSPETRCLVYSGHADEETILESLEAGAVGFVGKEVSFEELVREIERAAEAEPADPEVTVAADAPAELSGGVRLRIERLLLESRPSMVFQPILDLETGEVVAQEALARFDHLEPKRAPIAWFHEARSVGLLTELELQAMRTALEALPRLPDDVRLAVNLSPKALASYQLLEVFDEIPWDRLVIELTDHADGDPALDAAVRAVASRGAKVAVDDAGEGHGSFEEVIRLSPNIVKVDLGVVRGIDTDATRQRIVAALVSLAAGIGAEVVAEGIETEQELATLRELGVSCGQGFLLGRPGELPSKQVEVA